MQALQVSHYTLTTALGAGVGQNWKALNGSVSGLKPCTFLGMKDLQTWTGEIKEIVDSPVAPGLSSFSCRNNQLAELALVQDDFTSAVETLIKKYGRDRVAVYMGTSTSGIQQTELAYAERQKDSDPNAKLPDWYHYPSTHNLFSPADYVRRRFNLSGPCLSISTACSSSAKVFASAQRAMATGLCDAAIVGGVDTLCFTTLYGFNSLQVVAQDICRPSDKNRGGISIGEAAGFAIVEREQNDSAKALVLGYGESSDAHHMSTPHPEGKGAALAMQRALDKAALSPESIDYINLHGTGTLANDMAEALAVKSLFAKNPKSLPCSSTKGWTGHTLGAAGIVEAIFSILAIENNYCPESLNTREVDPLIDINILMAPEQKQVRQVLSNSIGFGGSNCTLIIGEPK